MQVENYIIKNSETIENTDRNRKRHIQIEMYMSLKYGRGDYLKKTCIHCNYCASNFNPILEI